MSEKQREERDRSLELVYADRNLLVMAFAKLAQANGWPVWVALDAVDADPAWPVLFIETPEGQVSYHMPADQVMGFWPGPEPGQAWDYHTTADKQKRLRAFIEYQAGE